jgi:hypothetical protein
MALNQVGLERLNTATTKKIGTSKNLIINGAMIIQQQMTSHTTGGQNLTGIKTVDRFSLNFSGTDNSPTQIPVDVAAGTTPYSLGFRRCFKIINGNQTSGAGSSDQIYISQKMEAQNIATSGWNYLSSSSNITLSFWVKSSVAQNFYGYLLTKDGSSYLYPFETGSLSADTWTKVTKTIPGNSNLTINNDNGTGLELVIAPFFGTDKTGSVSLNAWGAYNSSVRVPDMTSTWYTTDDATFEITGVQLEVGSVATDFEHSTFKDELRKCQRYFTRIPNQDASSGYAFLAQAAAHDTNSSMVTFHFPVFMRSNPSMSTSGSFRLYNGGGIATTSIVLNTSNVAGATLQVSTSSGIDRYEALVFGQNNDSNAAIDFTAEL